MGGNDLHSKQVEDCAKKSVMDCAQNGLIIMYSGKIKLAFALFD